MSMKFRILLITFFLVAFPVNAEEKVPESDVVAAEEIILSIKILREADERTYERVTDALAATEEGKKELRTCKRSKNDPLWRACLTQGWLFDKAYDQLYDKFYKEELEAVLIEKSLKTP